MTGTRERIMYYGELLLRSRGYAGLNYSFISDELKIKNAAVHYHFRHKEDLVTELFQKAAEQILENSPESPVMQLNKWFDKIKDDIDNGFRVCLFGSVAADLDRIPEDVRNAALEYSEIRLRFFWGCNFIFTAVCYR